MRDHSRASQLGALVATISMALMSLPTFAQTEGQAIDIQYSHTIASAFRRPGLPTSYDNTTLQNSAFDFQAYVSHTCFKPTEFDKPTCKEAFGPYADFRETLESGKLDAILRHHGVIVSVAEQPTIVASIAEKVTQEEKSREVALTDEELYARKLQERSQQVWNACVARYNSQEGRNSCFQRNDRLVQNFDVAVRGNVF